MRAAPLAFMLLCSACATVFTGTVRLATLSDVDAVVNVALAAMLGDPSWSYRYPYRMEYAEDHHRYNWRLFEYMISPEHDDWEVVLAEHPADENPARTIVAAFAVWNASYINLRTKGPNYIPQSPVEATDGNSRANRRDVDWAHMDAFREGTAKVQANYFDPQYGDDQLRLQVLGTLPQYRRRGLATALCQWGMNKAEKDNVPITAVSGPMGFALYSHLQFRNLGEGYIQADGEVERLLVHAMDFASNPNRGSRLELL